MSKQLTASEQNQVNLATNIIKERGGTVDRIKIQDLNSSGYAVDYRSATTYREIVLYGTSERSPQETIQGKVRPDSLQKDLRQEIYTGR